MKMVSLRTKLAVSYIFVVMFCVTVVSLLANLFMEKHFREYVRQNQERRNKQVVTSIGQQYQGPGKWRVETIADIGINALEQGIIVKVTDLDGLVVWDAAAHNSGLCQQMISHMAENMYSRYPSWKGEYVVAEYPVSRNFQKVGQVFVGYYGPIYFNDHDLAYINALNRMLLWVAVAALFVAFLIGAIMAKRLSKPIASVIEAAEEIAKGSYDIRTESKTNVREIKQLTSSINELAHSLKKQEQLRKRLTADVAHELRTPLATLQSHMEAILDGIWRPEPERLKVCHNEVLRLNRLVAELAKLAKYENEELSMEQNRFDLAGLVKEVILNFESEFNRKGVFLSYNLEPAYLKGDRDKLSQVLINLLSNALKFTEPGGRVELTVKNTEQGVLVSVKDTGTGISASDLPYIFDRFYRADQSRNRMTGGAGIGLTIVKAIIEAHHGEITVNSRLGAGTEFTILLPANLD